eukprot:Hpha_TRINITY_DN13389_c0_g1::TRINITY_DN13389_c0_g1_i1::g.95399::m.95399
MAEQQELLSFECSGCHALIGYPPGACLVQCSKCARISNLEQGTAMIQIPCVSCTAVLSFPSSVSMALCPLCGVFFSVQTQVAQAAAPGAAPATSFAEISEGGEGAVRGEAQQSQGTGSIWQGQQFSEGERVAQRRVEADLAAEFAAATQERDTARLLKQRRR